MARVDLSAYPFYPREEPLDLGGGHRAHLLAPRVSYYVPTDTARWLSEGRLPRHGYERRVEAAGRSWWLGRTQVGGQTVWHIH